MAEFAAMMASGIVVELRDGSMREIPEAAWWEIHDRGHLLLRAKDDNDVAMFHADKWVSVKYRDKPTTSA